jgi:hypothetical protein
MPRLRSPKEICIKYLDKSLAAYLLTHRWGQKPIHLNNIMGRIRNSGLTIEEIANLLREAKKNWILDKESEEKYNQLIAESKKEGWI